MKWIALMMVAATAYAQRPLPEELGLARSITMQEQGEMQVTPGFQFFKLPDEKRLTWGLDAEYGLSDRLELDAEVPYIFRNPKHERSVNGLGDIEATLRYGFVPMSKDNTFSFNAGLAVVAPTGDRTKDLGDEQLALGPVFAISDWFGPVNVQVSGAWTRAVTNGGEEPRDEYEYNVAVLLPVHDVFVGLEGNGESNHRRTKYYVTPEVVWRPRHSFQIQLAAPIGVTRAAGDYGLIASMSFEFAGPFSHDND